MCMGCSLYECVKRKPISEKYKAVVLVDQLKPLELRQFKGLLSWNGYRHDKGTVHGRAAMLIWILDWS